MIKSFLVAAAASIALGGVAHAGNNGFPVNWQASVCPSGSTASQCIIPTGINGGYSINFADEFTTLSLGNDGDTGVNWWASIHPVLVTDGSEKQAYAGDPTAYTVDGSGILSLTTRYSTVPGDTRYVECDMETADNHGHGRFWTNFYAEIRVQGVETANNHLGVWLLSKDNGATDTTGGHYEFDILEQYGPADQYDHHASHVWPGRRTDISHIFNSELIDRGDGNTTVQWHTYGVLATPTVFALYKDGQPWRYIQRLSSQQNPVYMLLSLFGNPANGTPVPGSMKVDYVRVYTPPSGKAGLP